MSQPTTTESETGDGPRVVVTVAYHPLAGLFLLMEGEAFDALCDDIRVNGLLEPVVLHHGLILDGRNCNRACLKVGVEPRYAEYEGRDHPDSLLAYVIGRNLVRRHLDTSQRAMIAAKLATMRSGTRTDLASIDARSDADAARLLDIGEASVERAKVVQREGIPELAHLVEQGEAPVSVAAEIARRPAEEQREILAEVVQSPDGKRALRSVAKSLRASEQARKRERRAEREAELGARIQALPDRRYGVIVEDYEWDYEVWSRLTGMDRHPSNHYPVSEDAHTAQEIVDRTKDQFTIAAPNCLLAMWSTVPHLAIAIDVLRLRGFRYVSHYVWGKEKIGTGYWNRNKHEVLLIGIRGEVPCPSPGSQRDSLLTAEAGEHSAKPELFLEMIEGYFPTVPKIELNRRGRPRPGWDAWGNEVT